MKEQKFWIIINYLKNLIKSTNWENHVFAVGGSCRDVMMNRIYSGLDAEIKDIDLLIDLPSGGINFAKWLNNKNLLIGDIIEYKTYGTAMFHLKEFSEEEIEAVQTRKEQYKDFNSRNPETIFGTIDEDCSRRDFTINSIYYNITSEQFYNYKQAVDDIKNKVIRTVSNPNIIFSEDPLRMMRAIRFASRLEWKISSETLQGIKDNVSRIKIIKQERITEEFNKTIICNKPSCALELYRETGLLNYIFPDFIPMIGLTQNKYHFGDVWEHTLVVLDNTENNLILRIAALFHDIGKIKTRSEKNGNIHFYSHELVGASISKNILKQMKYSNNDINLICKLIKYHMWQEFTSNLNKSNRIPDKIIRKYQYLLGNDWKLEIDLMKADRLGHSINFSSILPIKEIENRSIEMVKNGDSMFNYNLPINGNDIIEYFNIPNGPIINKCKLECLKHAYDNPFITKDECLKFCKNIILNFNIK